MVQTKEQMTSDIMNNRTYLGIELGSTRIKAVLVDSTFETIASGSFEWENKLEHGFWTYSLDDVWKGIQQSYQKMTEAVFEKYDIKLQKIGVIGFSAMMHGYMTFDKEDKLLVPFRTWRNATTTDASRQLTECFNFNIPERWSIAHYYQAILSNEKHVTNIDYLTTLAGYVHWKLTGNKVLGIGDASGMFPIDTINKDYDEQYLADFEKLVKDKGISIHLKSMLPKILMAGELGGELTDEGALLLDPRGHLKAGIPFCPPEGDAGTGMVATNSTEVRKGNISVGTSAFAMIVLEKKMKSVYPEIDLVTTPDGNPVAMVHANNCSSDISAWIKLFSEYTDAIGCKLSQNEIYAILFNKALEADPDLGGLLSYGYLSGENITKVNEGRPLFARLPDGKFNLANFMKVHLSSAFSVIRVGMDILSSEKIKVDELVGHGGIFKTPKVGQSVLASAINIPIKVMETAGEGGAWGMAVLSAFAQSDEKELSKFLNKEVFNNSKGITLSPNKQDVENYNHFYKRYMDGIVLERIAAENFKE